MLSHLFPVCGREVSDAGPVPVLPAVAQDQRGVSVGHELQAAAPRVLDDHCAAPGHECAPAAGLLLAPAVGVLEETSAAQTRSQHVHFHQPREAVRVALVEADLRG